MTVHFVRDTIDVTLPPIGEIPGITVSVNRQSLEHFTQVRKGEATLVGKTLDDQVVGMAIPRTYRQLAYADAAMSKLTK